MDTPEEFYYEYKVMGRKGDLTKEECIEMLTKYSQQKQDYIETLESAYKHSDKMIKIRNEVIDNLIKWYGKRGGFNDEILDKSMQELEIRNAMEIIKYDTRCHKE